MLPQESHHLLQEGYNVQERNRFGLVYERRIHPLRDKVSTQVNTPDLESRPELSLSKSCDLDLPIALRKEKRFCVKYLISNYVSNSKSHHNTLLLS